MTDQHDPHKAVDFILSNASKFAQAKANRVYIEGFLKSKKALLMNSCDEKSAVAREQFAYSHPEYIELLTGLKSSIEVEETLKWQITAAQARVEIWKTECYLNGRLEKSVR